MIGTIRECNADANYDLGVAAKRLVNTGFLAQLSICRHYEVSFNNLDIIDISITSTALTWMLATTFFITGLSI